MYIPKFNQVTDAGVMLEFMQHNAFATLVSLHQGMPFATPIPFVVESTQRLTGHMAKANPQWTSFEQNGQVLIIFQGHHSFISPTWYEKHPSVPTWNYMTVQAYGKLRVVEEPEAVKELLHALVSQYEQEWKMEELPETYLHGMMQGIVAFEIEITRLEGKFKLSQNRSQADQKRVVEALGASSNPSDRAIAEQMAKHLEKQ
ncbi:MAG: FMN-binding negative transcriptional regulator [Thermaceae bacterium]|nr:FMN-binding negative transcriptional regulator [Thermaceae bacterium]